eukprot:1148399-Pelagomonas_calceolata.AAC.3
MGNSLLPVTPRSGLKREGLLGDNYCSGSRTQPMTRSLKNTHKHSSPPGQAVLGLESRSGRAENHNNKGGHTRTKPTNPHPCTLQEQGLALTIQGRRLTFRLDLQ